MKKVLMSLLAIGAMTISANAACTTTGCSDVGVDRFLVGSTGNILVAPVGGLTGVNCTPVLGYYVTIQAADPGAKAIYSYLLTAKTTNQNISFAVVDGSATCDVALVY